MNAYHNVPAVCVRHHFIAYETILRRWARRGAARSTRPQDRACARALRVSVESDAGSLGGLGLEYFAERIDDGFEFAIVATLEGVHSVSELRVARDGVPQPHERSNVSAPR